MSSFKPRPRTPGNMHPGAQTSLKSSPNSQRGFSLHTGRRCSGGLQPPSQSHRVSPKASSPRGSHAHGFGRTAHGIFLWAFTGGSESPRGQNATLLRTSPAHWCPGLFPVCRCQQEPFHQVGVVQSTPGNAHSPAAALVHRSFCMPALGRAHERTEGCRVERTDNGPALTELLLLQGHKTTEGPGRKSKAKEKTVREGLLRP